MLFRISGIFLLWVMWDRVLRLVMLSLGLLIDLV